jgi:hypothetical protein
VILEIIAAVVVGSFALALILEPLVRSTRPAPAPLELPDPEETPRGIALEALREIEFDRETGKLSDADYVELKDKYTQVAVRAMRAEERDLPATEPAGATEPLTAVEAIIAAKVRAIRSLQPSGASAPACPTCGPRPEPDAIFCSSCGDRLPTGVACSSCRAPLAHDAGFCEACGSQQVRSA